MKMKKIAIQEELHKKLLRALSEGLGVRESVMEKSLDHFLADLLEHLANEPETLRELLSTGPRRESRGRGTPPSPTLSTGSDGSR